MRVMLANIYDMRVPSSVADVLAVVLGDLFSGGNTDIITPIL